MSTGEGVFAVSGCIWEALLMGKSLLRIRRLL